ncbi:MAG: phosphate/phosphite/phosphonate ABC transporter substrate-binding protein [Chloroflexi bacterium]|nr:MAG: phosphate/phosphite/phosphonate ABC transporter substrate-binding protein [Chloroflexota bacterium]
MSRFTANSVGSQILLATLLLLLLSGCGAVQAASLPYVDLSNREPLPAAAPAEVIPLRLAVAAIISPEGTVDSYSGLAQYLGQKLHRPVELIQRRTYAEANDLIAQNAVDLAFVCTSAYVDGHESFGMELLVAPEVNGELVYYSKLIVPAASSATSIADLRGRVFAFTDPMSHSGRVYPTYLLQQLETTPEEFFSRTIFTYSHDKAIEAVAHGVADGAAVDSLVLDFALQRDPSLAERIKVIHTSPPFGIPPVVVPPQLSPRQKALLRDILLDMPNDPEGRKVLGQLGFDRFTILNDAAYNTARQVIATTGVSP